MPVFEDLKVFGGNAHPELLNDICAYLGIGPGEIEVFKFSNDNTFVRILENIRERDVFIVQPLSAPVNDNLMELLIMLDAARRASAGRITAVIPYYAYGRSDKKDQPRVPITARLVANLIEVSGADRVLTIDLHAGQIQGFFNIPVDELSAVPMLSNYYLEKNFEDVVVMATDVGDAKRAGDTAKILNADIAIIEKHRIGNKEMVEVSNLIGEVGGRTAIIVDDEILTGGTVIAAAEALVERGAKEIWCGVTHGILSGRSPELIENSAIKEFLVTDTLPISEDKRGTKTKLMSVASLLGEAIYRIHNGHSVGAMFEE
ncbi:MAG: ribose-phosphate pyrophosphokinase [SAR202 cluster bacterium]|nr:ribose-phosphate pyrophosphokinase [SAR202 cluster bacterium]MDP6512650.1 ribose-phosphate pyrophosphokinase [SAR202 cluster bacterium]